jgi:CheY-like chemotaxis protein
MIKHILLAEDDPHDVELTLAALDEHNLANGVVVVNDGAEALDYLYCRGKFKARASGLPVVVLLDLKMPKVSGLEVLKIIKGDANLKTTPVVVLTSSREEPDLIESYEYGVNAYVVKPVDFSDFIKAVKRLGIFWAAINEPPRPLQQEETPKPNAEVMPGTIREAA